VVRLKAPQDGETIVRDRVQGEVRIANQQLDDKVLLRGDGTPTYMLSVVVDDHDMAITHVIRGDDHLTNAFRQLQIYSAMGWSVPEFAHLPLIHGADGAKLSKRHGALGIEAYRDMGYLPEALRNYLLRLGWGHGDDEIISTSQAVQWFDLDAVGRAPSRFELAKLENQNGHYIREAHDDRLVDEVVARLDGNVDEAARTRLARGMAGLKSRAKNLKELAENAGFYVSSRPIKLDPRAQQLTAGPSIWPQPEAPRAKAHGRATPRPSPALSRNAVASSGQLFSLRGADRVHRFSGSRSWKSWAATTWGMATASPDALVAVRQLVAIG
jgi:glutamyl-tRNA synthetase